MTTWPTIPFRETGTWLSGGTPKRDEPAFWGGSIPWIGTKDLKSFDLVDSSEFVTDAGADAGSRVVDAGAVLFVTRGMSLAKEFRVGVAARRLAFNQDVKAIVPRRDLDSRFLAWFLRAKESYILDQCDTATHGTKRLPLERIERMPVPMPTLAEQRRIAALLDEADALRRKRRESLALLDDLVHSIFVEIVGEGSPHHASWPVRRVEDLAARTPSAMRTGPFGSALLHSEFVDDGIAVLGIDNAVQNRFAWGERRFITPEKYEELRRYTVFPDDVIITIMGTTGRSAVVPAEVPTAITTKHLATITPNTLLVRPEFLSNAIHRDSGVLRQIGTKNRGAIMDGLNLGIIRELEIRVPPLDTQQTFERTLGEIRSLEAQQRAGLDQAQQLFDSLLHRVFGALETSDAS